MHIFTFISIIWWNTAVTVYALCFVLMWDKEVTYHDRMSFCNATLYSVVQKILHCFHVWGQTAKLDIHYTDSTRKLPSLRGIWTGSRDPLETNAAFNNFLLVRLIHYNKNKDDSHMSLCFIYKTAVGSRIFREHVLHLCCAVKSSPVVISCILRWQMRTMNVCLKFGNF